MPREKEAGLGGMKAVADTVGGARGRPESSKEARETGDVKTGREGTAGRAKARKGDWAATWVPRQARNKTRDNNFRIPPPAHDVGGKDAEASRLGRARLGTARQGKAAVVCKGQRIGRCPEPCADVPAWNRAARRGLAPPGVF